MLTLPAAVLAALEGNDIWTISLVTLEIGGTTYRLSDHYREIADGTDIYLPNGNLLTVANIQNAIGVNDNSLNISLSGIDEAFRFDVLNADSIGGVVSVKRGVVDTTTGGLLGTPTDLFSGIIYQVSIIDDNPNQPSTSPFTLTTFSITVDVRSDAFLLDTTPGRFTEEQSNRQVDDTDLSMNFVPTFDGVPVRFGGET